MLMCLQAILSCRMHIALGSWLRLCFVAATWRAVHAALARLPVQQAAPYDNYPLPDDISSASHVTDIITIEGNVSSRPGSSVFHISTNVQVSSPTVRLGEV